MDKYALINKFLDNKCNTHEVSIVLDLFEKQPEILDEVLGQSEWEALEESKKNDGILKDEIWFGVKKVIKEPTIAYLPKLLFIAASLLFFIGVTALLYNNLVVNKGMDQSATVSEQIQFTTLKNSTAYVRKFSFVDGSMVTLYPNSSIRYPEDFRRNRSITLTGKALFKVAKDSQHPFRVRSGEVVTTALGTEFLVDNSDKNIVVQLFEGKIVVSSVRPNSKIKGTYLSAGEQCFIDPQRESILVTKLNEVKNEAGPDREVRINKADLSNSDLKFLKIPLPEVFSLLESRYAKKITYQLSDMKGKYFTGYFSESETFEHIMKTISQINGLHVVTDSMQVQISVADGKMTEQRNTIEDIDGKKYRKLPLGSVLLSLEKSHGVKIDFNEQDIKNKYFTGQIAVADDISKVLNLIGTMNGLQVIEDSRGFKMMKLKK